ncbi:MAG: class I SAM-dependent methyltransferase [Cyanobacteria bacterium]|nr:class I SAM-dependent methyltransferase [Cyanobacteriota bacterium]
MEAVYTNYFGIFAAAFVRGKLTDCADLSHADSELTKTPLLELTEEQVQRLIELGKERDLKIHKFKKTMGLQRVQSVLGILKGLQPSELLDIGTGRGVFLWPLLDELPWLSVTCIDLNSLRVRDLNAVRDGGISRLKAIEGDIALLDVQPNSFDVVTFLEALEHIPNPQAALDKAASIARRSLILSVPSHEDDNDEHIHLFTRDTISSMLLTAGARRVNVQYVLNHLIAVANFEPC